jgi:dual specificity phosphatase 12
MEEIIPGLWIGDLACALATDYLSLAGITHVVTAMKQRIPSPIQLPDGRKIEKAQMYHVNIDDVDNAPLLVHFPGAVDFIDGALEQRWLEDEQEEEGIKDGEEENQSGNINGEGSSSSSVLPNNRKKGQWATTGEGTVLVHCQAGVSRSVAVSCSAKQREVD